jgi:hypothetical protein
MREFYLKNPVAYHLGADIWGMIYDMYGKEKTSEIILTLSRFANMFNAELGKLNKSELMIEEK